MATRRRRTDAAARPCGRVGSCFATAVSRALFLGDVIADLIRIVLPALAAELDLDAIEPLPTEFIGLDRSKRIGDAAYRIPFLENADRSAITAAEFQGGPDAGMLGRTRGYTEAMLADFLRRGVLREGEHPLVLPFVIHTGAARWSADDGTERVAGLSAEAVREVALWQPQAYIAMDLGGGAALPPGAPDNRFLAAARLVVSRTMPALVDQLKRERRRFAGPAELAFRQGMHAWVEEAVLGTPDSGVALPSFEELEGAKEAEMTYLFKDKVDRFKAEIREEGHEEGHAEGVREGRGEGIVTGQRDLLVSMAERRFGAAASRQVAAALDGRPSARQLAETSDLILACETLEEFVSRLSR